MNIWQMFGSKAKAEAAPVRVERQLLPVTPRRVGPPPVVGQEKAEVKCAWCNSKQQAVVPTGPMPTTLRCTECDLESYVLPSGITMVVPRDSVARQIARGGML